MITNIYNIYSSLPLLAEGEHWNGLMVHMWKVLLGTLTMLGLNFFSPEVIGW